MSDKNVENIVVVGASAGGVSAVMRMMSSFAEPVNAALFVVIHVAAGSLVDVILNQVQRHSKMKCKIPHDGEAIRTGVIYFAPADHHMLIDGGHICVQKGPHENHWRPSIDVLFRTAAAAYGSCVTGVILTGMLDDGVSGMAAIKRCGGRCIVQDPSEAEFRDMPDNVIRNVNVDFKVSADEMGYVITDILARKECVLENVPDDLKVEADITLRMSSKIEKTLQLGEMTQFTCPDCGGVLTEIPDSSPKRYRCFTGHSFTSEALYDAQKEEIEESLWVAIRMMEERKNLIWKIVEESGGRKVDLMNKTRIERAEQLDMHINRLKDILKAGE